jgi:hypothetical protein
MGAAAYICVGYLASRAIGMSAFAWKMALFTALLGAGGCSTIRITDPERTADEEFLENVATASAVERLSATVLRDRKVYVDSTYLTASTQPSDEQQYLLGELRAKLLLNGVRLVSQRESAEIIMEVRSQGISVNHIEFLLGVPSSTLGGLATGVAVATPEIAVLKNTKQQGFASVAFVAYWRDTGEVVASSGPMVGRTIRDDWWFLGFGPSTYGNIPPTEPEPTPGSGGTATTTQTQTPAKSKPAKGSAN